MPETISSNQRGSSQPGSSTRPKGAATIELDDLTKQYPGEARPAVDHISMTIEAGEIVVFVGPSGCGKTTTMKMINRLIEPTSGRILLDGSDVLQLDGDEHRRSVGYVMQQTGLLPHMTIAQNVALVPKMAKWDKGKISSRVQEMLDLVGLDPKQYGKRYPRQLSGGQQQRVGVARALAADPAVMLMDEPFGATDPITRDRLQNEFLRLQAEIRKTIVFVTHDFDEALKMGDKIAVLREGSVIAQYDTPENILKSPADAYVSDFIGSGGQLKRLALIPVTSVEIGAAPSDRKHLPMVADNSSLRDALDAMLEAGQELALVGGGGDGVRGVVTLQQVMDAVREAVPTDGGR